MKSIRFLWLVVGLVCLTSCSRSRIASSSEGSSPTPAPSVLGMYVHEGWPYNHPYAPRTWTVEDWGGYADGLKRLGYNLVIIWPNLEMMPNPLTPSDRAQIEKTAQVIDILHHDFGMRALVVISPNVVARNEVAAQYTFERRYFYPSTTYLNPADPAAVAEMMRRREELLRPLAQMDGLVIIDSDPAGYPGSTNDQFVNLLVEYRRVLDRLRPGIELRYWMHAGWEAYSRYFATGEFKWATLAESEDVLTRLKKADLRPWGITIPGAHPQLAERMGLASNALAFNYSAVEAEPSYPMTNFGGDKAFNGGAGRAPGGVAGNAQTHCVQLPNTFAFARGAKGQPITEADYVQFANDLIAGQGQVVAGAWKALVGTDTTRMRTQADTLAALSPESLAPGPLKGLLFGNPQRFISDLTLELRMKAACLELVAASKTKVDKNRFRAFLAATKGWQAQHGYQAVWIMEKYWPGLQETLSKLNSPTIDELLAEPDNEHITTQWEGNTPFERRNNLYRKWETHTPRLIAAMEAALKDLK